MRFNKKQENTCCHATVNVIYIEEKNTKKILFIKRRENPWDPWSGDIGFPGGLKKRNEDPIETALRETEEEVGIPRKNLEVKGLLFKETTNVIPGFQVGVVLSKLNGNPRNIKISSSEIKNAFWTDIESIVGPYKLFHPFKKRVLEAYVFDSQIIWGLTKRILDKILPILRSTKT